MPLRVFPLPHGRRVLVLTGGYHDHSLSLVDLGSGRILHSLELGKAWAGLAVDPRSSTVFVSGGGPAPKGFEAVLEGTPIDPTVRESLSTAVLRVSVEGDRLVPQPALAIPGTEGERPLHRRIGGRAGRLVVRCEHANRHSLQAPSAGWILLASVQVGYRPFAIALSRDSLTLAVSNWGDKTVSLLDASSLKETSRIAVGAHPSDLAYGPDGRLFVANAGSNSVSVIADGQVIETIGTSLDPHDPVGSTPDALAVSSDGKFLYVANADNNDAAVINIAQKGNSSVEGFIPTGWYPSALAITPDGKKLLVATGKGMGSRGTVPALGKRPAKDPDPATPYDYVGDILAGHLEIIAVPRPKELKAYTTTGLCQRSPARRGRA